MPDWIHSLLYILILISVLSLSVYFITDILGLLVGVFAGHTIASFIVSRLPGFWGDRK